MEKKILQYSYWLGIACLVVAVVGKACLVTGICSTSTMQALPLTYMGFVKGAVMFLLTAVATGTYQASNRS